MTWGHLETSSAFIEVAVDMDMSKFSALKAGLVVTEGGHETMECCGCCQSIRSQCRLGCCVPLGLMRMLRQREWNSLTLQLWFLWLWLGQRLAPSAISQD